MASRVDLTRLLLLWLAALATFFVARLLFVDWLHLQAPYDTDYETAAWATSQVMGQGLNPYSPDVYAAPPFVVTMYTPAYFGLAAALEGLGPHPFFVGRLITALSLLVVGALLVLCARRRAVGALLFGGLGGLWFVLDNAAQFRPDLMAVACAAGAVVAAERPTPRRLVAAGLLILLALSSKQNLVSSGAAITIALLVRDRALGVRFLVAMLVAGVLTLLGFHLAFGAGFWTSTLGLPAMAPFSLGHGALNLKRSFEQPYALSLVVLVLAIAIGRIRAAPNDDDALPMAHEPRLWWAIIATVVQLLGLFKVGSGPNYLIEPLVAWMFVAARAPAPLDGRRLVTGLAALAALIGTADLIYAPARAYSAVSLASDDDRRKFGASMRATVTALAGPHAVVVHPQFSRHAPEVSRHVVINDPWLYGEAWRRGALPREALERAIAGHDFDIIMLSTPRGPRAGFAIEDEVVRPWVSAHYRLAHTGNAFEYWLPAP